MAGYPTGRFYGKDRGMKAKLGVCLVMGLLAVGCSSSTTDTQGGGGESDGGAPGKTGKTFATEAEAPSYAGTAYSAMKIYDVETGVYYDDAALFEALDEEKMIFFGEQHETAPVQELQLWLLKAMTDRHQDVTLAMEHFQHDEQPIIDKYLAGEITTAEFEETSSPWPKYQLYWKPLVEHMKSIGRPVVGLNVPKEALSSIYGAYPAKPLDTFNSWGASHPYNASLAPRPVPKWDADYQTYFKGSFDYEAHGKGLGMTYDEALDYFTDLAVIRDETMGYFAAETLKTGARVFTVAGDWHVQFDIATPVRAARYAGEASAYALVSTSPKVNLDTLLAETQAGHKVARYILVYEAN